MPFTKSSRLCCSGSGSNGGDGGGYGAPEEGGADGKREK
jgi:hypothetical protein